jgi:initiation factor 1A
MGKNTQGGSSHKKFARKFNTNSSSNFNRLRVSEDEAEIYAIVTKILGNGMFHCHCLDNKIRLGHIRGKFSGRGKRDNLVEGGKWVLIGLREWDIPNEKSSVSITKEKMQQCDLLEVYTDSDKQRLKESVPVDWYILDYNDVSRDTNNHQSNDDDVFMFTTDKDIERQILIEKMNSSTTEKISLKLEEKTEGTQEEEINIDDI